METSRNGKGEMNAILVCLRLRVNRPVGSDKHSMQSRCVIALREGVLVGLHFDDIAGLDLARGGDCQARECLDRELRVAGRAGFDLSPHRDVDVSGDLGRMSG